MKMIVRSLILFGLLLVPLSGRADDDLGTMRLSLIEGDIQVLIQDTTDWTPAAINLPMHEHDRLWAPEGSRAELQIQGGVYARVEGKTAMDILTLERNSGQFYLDQGHLYLNNRQGGIEIIQIDTPGVSLRSYDNSIMMVDVTEDGVNEISVLKGMVYAESRAGVTRVSAGDTLTIRGDHNAEVSPIAAPDDWERWNLDRDRVVSSWSISSRYLPEELHEYSSDLDRHGRWDYTADYGYVWFPRVTAGWAPYSYGSWVWIRGNYVWVDYDPWGWAPSHYGRWVFTGAHWCWVPPARGAVYWAPGYVGWVVTASYVAWVPLAPGEVYYGYGYYGPGSVNITTVNIDMVVVNRHYRNARVNNSVVAVRRDSFGTGRRVPVRVDQNPFAGRERHGEDARIVPPRQRPERPVTIAPPEIRERQRSAPERRQASGSLQERRTVPGDSALTSGRRETTRRERAVPQPAQRPTTAPSAQQPQRPMQQPPERVRRSRPETLKNERPLVREQGASVFQNRPPQDLTVTRSQQPRTITRRPAPAPGPRAAVPKQQQQPQRQRSPVERHPGR
ncbi:MAG: hypothetical protein A2010_16175 [Nitrospirae bacterium GWD2_57_9]|nr:MAG: hypothetical protein A2010_16175 [Nitrospirae bacterium GWD2_57_9]